MGILTCIYLNKLISERREKAMCKVKCQDCLLSDSDKVCQYCQNYRYKDYNHICIKDSKKLILMDIVVV